MRQTSKLNHDYQPSDLFGRFFIPLHQISPGAPEKVHRKIPYDRSGRSAKPYVCPLPTSVRHLAVMLQRGNRLNGNYTIGVGPARASVWK
jgi:hypothetical protein